jgi:hypothetical protein
MANHWRQMTDEQLIEEANTGLRGQGAPIEMLRGMEKSALNRLTAAIAIGALGLAALQVFRAHQVPRA